MNTRKTFRLIWLGSIVLLLASSCKVMEPTTPAVAPVPEKFTATVDTAKSSGSIPWSGFFDDQHLVGLIREALANNPDMHIAQQRVEAAGAIVRARKGALLPSLTVAAAAGQRRFGEYTMDGIGNFDTNFSENIQPDQRIPEHLPDYYLGLQSSWEIDIWQKLRYRKRAAASRFLATAKGKQWVTTSLIASVATAYYDLLALDNALVIVRENIRLQQQAVELIQIQKQAGRATELAVKQFRAQLLNTQSLEVQVQQQIIETENQVNVLLGRFAQPVQRGLPILNQQLPEEVHAGVPAEMLRHRPDVQKTELEWLASQSDVKAARAAFFPSLTITSSVGFQSFNPDVLFNPASLAYNIFGGLATPLFHGNALRAEYRMAAAYQTESFMEYRKTVLDAYREVVNGLNGIENLSRLSALKEQEVAELQAAVSASNDLFTAGFASYLEVITAQKSVLEAELALADTRRQQFFVVVGLYKALGGGWE